MDDVKFLRAMKLGVTALGVRAEEHCADFAVKLERVRTEEGYETFIAKVTRPAAPAVAPAERDASIAVVLLEKLCWR